jgi:hypothetical protein
VFNYPHPPLYIAAADVNPTTPPTGYRDPPTHSGRPSIRPPFGGRPDYYYDDDDDDDDDYKTDS